MGSPGLPGPPGPRGLKGDSYSQGDPRYHQDSESSQADARRLSETLDYSNVALRVTDYIRSEWIAASGFLSRLCHYLNKLSIILLSGNPSVLLLCVCQSSRTLILNQTGFGALGLDSDL